MKKVYTSPEKIVYGLRDTIFLAGTIDNGVSFDWQKSVINEMKDYKITLLNPRRKKWNEELQKEELENQIKWELDALGRCDFIFMYFAPGSMSPISLLELGLHIRNRKMIVVCNEGYYRYTNVKVVCERYGVKSYCYLIDGIQALKDLY